VTDQPLNRLRHDTADLFRLELLAKSPWAMTPCVVQRGDEWFSVRHAGLLLHLPDETEVLCPWPGKTRTDVFRFTVGDFRAACAAREKAEVAAEQQATAREMGSP